MSEFQIEYNGKLYDVEIVDTAGQEEFSSFRDSSVATGDAFLVLFAINSASSWHELQDLRSKIIQDHQSSSAIPMVLVANKLVSFIGPFVPMPPLPPLKSYISTRYLM